MPARRKPAATPRIPASPVANPAALRTGFFEEVRTILQQARQKAYAASNFIMVEAYWNIGRRIVQEEQGGKDRADYGKHLIRNLARTLGEEFGHGVSIANLKNFRQFYLTFPDTGKSYALRSQLTWTHWRLLMRVEDPAARDYYISESAEHGWNTRQLAASSSPARRNSATNSNAAIFSNCRIPENLPMLEKVFFQSKITNQQSSFGNLSPFLPLITAHCPLGTSLPLFPWSSPSHHAVPEESVEIVHVC